MALHTRAENRNLAQRIHIRLGPRITVACENSLVPTAFLAGLISVENASLDSNARRFEQGVFIRLQRVRDGRLGQFNGIRQPDIAGTSDAALRNLATSFGLTQILGLHVIATFKNRITVDDLRDPEQHLGFAVEFVQIEAPSQLRNRAFDRVLRIHNTGRPNGITFDPNYVPNALGVMREYEILEG